MSLRVKSAEATVIPLTAFGAIIAKQTRNCAGQAGAQANIAKA
jgi:hypothetical protein